MFTKFTKFICTTITLLLVTVTSISGMNNYIKIAVVGEPGSGKTSLLRSIEGKSFDPCIPLQIAITYNYEQLRPSQGQGIHVTFIDTPGQEIYRPMCMLFTKDTHIDLVCLELSSPDLIEQVIFWVGELGNARHQGTQGIIIVLTKSDSSPDSSTTIIERLTAVLPNIPPVVCTSAKTGEGIENLKNEIVNQCLGFTENLGMGLDLQTTMAHPAQSGCCKI